MLMGCDGIWEMWTEKELIAFVDKRIKDRNTVTETELS
jgi:serine/threonine protein phosphatase PrpC